MEHPTSEDITLIDDIQPQVWRILRTEHRLPDPQEAIDAEARRHEIVQKEARGEVLTPEDIRINNDSSKTRVKSLVWILTQILGEQTHEEAFINPIQAVERINDSNFGVVVAPKVTYVIVRVKSEKYHIWRFETMVDSGIQLSADSMPVDEESLFEMLDDDVYQYEVIDAAPRMRRLNIRSTSPVRAPLTNAARSARHLREAFVITPGQPRSAGHVKKRGIKALLPVKLLVPSVRIDYTNMDIREKIYNLIMGPDRLNVLQQLGYDINRRLIRPVLAPVPPLRHPVTEHALSRWTTYLFNFAFSELEIISKMRIDPGYYDYYRGVVQRLIHDYIQRYNPSPGDYLTVGLAAVSIVFKWSGLNEFLDPEAEDAFKKMVAAGSRAKSAALTEALSRGLSAIEAGRFIQGQVFMAEARASHMAFSFDYAGYFRLYEYCPTCDRKKLANIEFDMLTLLSGATADIPRIGDVEVGKYHQLTNDDVIKWAINALRFSIAELEVQSDRSVDTTAAENDLRSMLQRLPQQASDNYRLSLALAAIDRVYRSHRISEQFGKPAGLADPERFCPQCNVDDLDGLANALMSLPLPRTALTLVGRPLGSARVMPVAAGAATLVPRQPLIPGPEPPRSSLLPPGSLLPLVGTQKLSLRPPRSTAAPLLPPTSTLLPATGTRPSLPGPSGVTTLLPATGMRPSLPGPAASSLLPPRPAGTETLLPGGSLLWGSRLPKRTNK